MLLSRGRADQARDLAKQTIELARKTNSVRDAALDALTIGRADESIALKELASAHSIGDARDGVGDTAGRLYNAAEGLQAAGQNEFVPRGLIARAAFRRAIGEWDGATRDLVRGGWDAEPGPMRLCLCRIALEPRAAGARADRSLRAAQWPRRAEPAAAWPAQCRRGEETQARSSQAAQRRAQN
jgi:hypothetical protein